jgi:hypothetical protein
MKKKTPWRDPIVEEIHRFREEWAAKFDYDLEKMYQELKRLEQEDDGLYVTLKEGKLVPVDPKTEAPVPGLQALPTVTDPSTASTHLDGALIQALDDSLIEEAVRVGDHQTKEEAVIAALQEYVQARKRQEIFELVGKVDYHADYDPKQLRDRKPQ